MIASLEDTRDHAPSGIMRPAEEFAKRREDPVDIAAPVSSAGVKVVSIFLLLYFISSSIITQLYITNYYCHKCAVSSKIRSEFCARVRIFLFLFNFLFLYV